MKKSIAIMIIAAAGLLMSCSRSITTSEAANGKVRCGRALR